MKKLKLYNGVHALDLIESVDNGEGNKKFVIGPNYMFGLFESNAAVLKLGVATLFRVAKCFSRVPKVYLD